MVKIKDFFKVEVNISKFIFSSIVVAAFVFVFGSPLYAQFLRQTGSTGWGYGYGYGYGFGFGWDEGAVAGYRTDFTYADEDVYGYGFGYGNLAESYDSETGVTLTSGSDLGTLADQGVVMVDGTTAAATSVAFNDIVTLNLSISAGTLGVTIPSGAVLTRTGGGTFDFTDFAAADQTSTAGGITNQSIQGAVQVGIAGIGLTSDTAITISIPVGTSLNGQGLNVYRSSTSATSGFSLLGSCTVASGLCTFTTTSLSYFAATSASSTTTTSTGGGGGGSVPVTEAEKTVTPIATPVIREVSGNYVTPADVDTVLSFLGATRNSAEEAKYATLIVNDIKEFKLTATDAQRNAMVNFVTYGISTATQKFGAGERRAILRDYLEIVGRAEISWADVEKMATGQKLVNRNLAKEQAQVGVVLTQFVKVFGHKPDFKNAKEDLAWNTMMYRIRFVRDLNKEKMGITDFKTKMKRVPTSPLDWSIVRSLGYIYR